MNRRSWLFLLLACCLSSLSTAAILACLEASPQVQAQAVGSSGVYVMATSGPNTKGTVEVFILDTSRDSLACYTRDGTGILYLGTRNIKADLIPDEVNPCGKRISVKEMKEKTGI
ncbi:MAG: hypothetical protein JXA90_15700 [Planctomycetes bacterium]|nr:hypothetical protein [Planctomycetota bacterium]